MNRRLLIIDDDPSLLELLRDELGRRQYDVSAQTSPEGALALLADQDFGVVLADICLDGSSGVDLCREAAALREDVPVIAMTAFASVESAVAAFHAGASDFVVKPLDVDALVVAIERALQHQGMRRAMKRLPTDGAAPPMDDMVGESDSMRQMRSMVARVAETDATVLVTGETGTGKELVSKALHARSARSGGPFVAISCAAMPDPLLEAELFGHEKGAFTDARTARPGLFLSASGGTLFLDEIGEMPLGMQAKVLRALQERSVRPVGGTAEHSFDTRIVVATNRDLEQEVAGRRFREDLYYRISVVPVRVPPLREREADVLLLAQAFLERCQSCSRGRVEGLTRAAAERLMAYPWPGNVRELQNCIERAVALSQFDHIGIGDLPERIAHYKPPRLECEPGTPSPIVPLEELERRHVLQVLDAMGGNKASAARALRVDRRTLYRKLERWASAA